MKDYKGVDWGENSVELVCQNGSKCIDLIYEKLLRSEQTGDIYIITLPYAPGDNIFVIERNNLHGGGVEVCEYMFLSVVNQAVIACPYNHGSNISDTVVSCMEETASNYLCRLSVFPAKDCYKTKEEADDALENER